MHRWIALVALTACTSTPKASPELRQEIEAWQAKREANLRKEGSWLSLVGLYWLVPGENRFGTAKDNQVVLPAGLAPEHAGSFFLEDGKVRMAGPAGERADLQESDRITVGDVTVQVIRRADKIGLRVRSQKSPGYAKFKGLDYFPIADSYKVVADFVPAKEPRTIDIATVIGTVEPMKVPGTLEFTLHGQKLTLTPVIEEEGATDLFILFRDATAGKETYGAGRFLYTAMPKDGKVTIDFNKAYNPPCAFTEFATCPLPPRENVLPVRIEAGEKNYGEH